MGWSGSGVPVTGVLPALSEMFGWEADLSSESSADREEGPKGFAGRDSVDLLLSCSLMELRRSSSV